MADIIVQGEDGTDVIIQNTPPIDIIVSGALVGLEGPPGKITGYTNVKDYGATGDGVTDDTQAITTAIVSTSPGGTIFFPAGHYIISTALTVLSHVTFQGSGAGVADGSGGGGGVAVSEIIQTNPVANGIEGVDVYDFTINAMTITGPSSGSGIGFSLTRSTNGDSRYIVMNDTVFQGFGSHGISIDGLIVSHFDGVITYGNGGNGFNLYASDSSAATSATFNSCWAHNNALIGWNIDHMVYSSFVACASDTNGVGGYLITNCQSVGFYSCGAESNVGNPYKVTGASYNVTLVSCWSFHNDSIALYVTGASQIVNIIGFHENTPTGTATASIKVDAGSTSSITGYYVITAVNLAVGTTTILNDGTGNAAIAGNLTTGGSVAVSGSVLAYKSGATALFKATDSANVGNISMSQIASGNGTIESTSAVSIVADSGSNAILSATNPQLLVQHLGGSYHHLDLGHDDTDGHIDTNAGSIILGPNSTLVLPSVNLSHSLGNSSFYWAALFSQVLNLNSTASISGGTAGTVAVTGILKVGNVTITSVTGGAAIAGSASGMFNVTDQVYVNALQTTGAITPDTTATRSIGSTSLRFAKGWFVDLEITNAPTVGGSAATGSGGLVRATSPTLVTPALGVPSAISLVNATSSTLPVAAINASGTPSSTTYLRGDGSWATPSGSSGITRSISSISTNTTAGATSSTDYVYIITSLSPTLTLPTAIGNTNRYTVINAGTGSPSVATTSSQTINGSSTASMPSQNMSLVFISDNANWHIE